MNNTNAFMANASTGLAFTIVLTVLSVLVFTMAVVFIWWVDIKKKPLKDFFAQIRNGLWFIFEQVYALFHTNSTVKTVYSDKSRNYSGTEFLPVPTKAPTNQYTYEFVGWDKNGVDEKGNMVVKAIYLQKVIKCYINIFDDDRETLLRSEVVEYGAGVSLDDLKPTLYSPGSLSRVLTDMSLLVGTKISQHSIKMRMFMLFITQFLRNIHINF